MIGGEGHHIYQHDGKFAKHHNADEHNKDMTSALVKSHSA